MVLADDFEFGSDVCDVVFQGLDFGFCDGESDGWWFEESTAYEHEYSDEYAAQDAQGCGGQ